MKKLLRFIVAIIFVLPSLGAIAQKIKQEEGDLSFLKGQKNIHVEFTYNNMKVGKYDQEQDYINDRKSELNKKEAGSGDRWAKAWVDDRKSRFEPQFKELFDKYCTSLPTTNKATTKYTMIYNTNFTEPGFNIGVARKKARHDAEILIVETANKSKVLAKISVEKALGRNFWGADFDTGQRITETYAGSGKALGHFIDKKLSK